MNSAQVLPEKQELLLDQVFSYCLPLIRHKNNFILITKFVPYYYFDYQLFLNLER